MDRGIARQPDTGDVVRLVAIGRSGQIEAVMTVPSRNYRPEFAHQLEVWLNAYWDPEPVNRPTPAARRSSILHLQRKPTA